MARGVNKVIIMGHLGADPEVKNLPSGDMVANFSLATTESWRDKRSGEMQERTEWHRVVLYGKPAEILQKYTQKGSKVYIEGALRTRKWQDKQGVERYTTEIIGNEFQLVDTRNPAQSSQYSQPARSSSFEQPQRATGNSEQSFASSLSTTDLDDEIPF